MEITTMDRLLTRNPTRSEFFLLYSKLLQERLPGWSVQFREESMLRVVNSDGKEGTVYLENLWLRFSANSEDRSKLLESYVRFVVALGSPAPKVEKNDIVAMIKDVEYVGVLGADPKSMTEHLCGDLWIVYAVDRPETIATLSFEDMSAAGVLKEELRALAVENLKLILPEVERHGGRPWYLLTAGSNYVASLLLFDEMWDQLAETVDGQIVATVPTRDVLMYTGTQSEDGVSGMRKRSSEIAASGPHAVSDSLIVRNDRKWAIFNAN